MIHQRTPEKNSTTKGDGASPGIGYSPKAAFLKTDRTASAHDATAVGE
jgi:hypothetical protein